MAWRAALSGVGSEGSEYQLGIEDIDGYVNRFVVPYLKYISEDMGCRAVRWYNHVNEPLRESYQAATPPEAGLTSARATWRCWPPFARDSTRAGLSHIGSMGPDACTHLRECWPIPHMLEIGADPDPYIQGYCMHNYQSRFDWDPPARRHPFRPHERDGG